MIAEGVKIMLLGMLTVYIMLGVLVVATVLASRIIVAVEGPPTPPGQPPSAEARPRESKPIAAIITAAIAAFRKPRRD